MNERRSHRDRTVKTYYKTSYDKNDPNLNEIINNNSYDERVNLFF